MPFSARFLLLFGPGEERRLPGRRKERMFYLDYARVLCARGLRRLLAELRPPRWHVLSPSTRVAQCIPIATLCGSNSAIA